MNEWENLLKWVTEEYRRATRKFGDFHNAHEGYAVLKEEVDELWDEIKGGQDLAEMQNEAIQVATMALRFIMDVCAKEGA